MNERNHDRDTPNTSNDDELFGDNRGDDLFDSDTHHRFDNDYHDYSDLDLASLSSFSDRDDSYQDIDDIIAQQSYENIRANQAIGNAPGAINLIPDASPDTKKKPNDDPGDNKWMKAMLFLALAFILVLVSGIIFGAWYKPEDNTGNVNLSGPVTIAEGEIIDPSNPPTTTDGTSGGSSDRVSDDDIRVPEGGSIVRYRIEVEGEVNAASVAYIDGSGDQESETGITSFPWEEALGMRDSTNPQIAINSSGYGTVTCIITQDGDEVAEKTVSGENPSVECSV